MRKKVIRGSGGGGGGGGGGTESPDSLRSKQIATVVDVLCEGPIVGLVNGMQSIFLNETVLMNPDGTGMVPDTQSGTSDQNSNFVNVSAQWRNGTQDQLPIDGIGDVEFESLVGTEVKYATPVIHSVTNAACNSIRVTVAVPMLTDQNKDNGDLRGSSVSFKIQVRPQGGSWVDKVTNTINGKTTTRYQRAFLIALDTVGPWDVRVVRTTVDSTSITISNSLFFDSVTGIIDSKLSYPNSALVAMRIDSSQFRSVPSRAFGIKGLIISVPTNYNPETRIYTGVWDGTFKQAWTDNPAWCFYDLLTARRYGLGDIISPSSVDKWSLYQIGQYCDQLVPTGFLDSGGAAIMEPRFTCNLLLQTAEESYTVIQNFASIFRAITFWAGGSIVAMQDRPGDPSALYTNANVIDGAFAYSGVSLKLRHTVALVAWNDPKDFYRQKVEYVQDDDGVKQFGVIQSEIVAFGCASKGQAHRMGKWLLATEKYATETISFRSGLDGTALYPGAIINTSDVLRAGIRMGGRIANGTTGAVTLDADAVIETGKSYSISLVTPAGALVSRNVTNAPGTYRTLNLSSALPDAPLDNAIFIVSASDLKPQSWRVVSCREAEDNQIEINAIAHIPELFDSVENGTSFTAVPTSAIKNHPDAPVGLTTRVSRYQISGGMVGMKVTLSWEGSASEYRVRYRRANGVWEQRMVNEPTLDIDNVEADLYNFEVVGLSSIGRESVAALLDVTLSPESVTLPNVSGFALESAFTASEAKVKWNAVPGATSYEVKMIIASTGVVVRTVNVGSAQRYEYNDIDMKADGGPWRSMKVQVRALGLFGAASAGATEITISNPQIAALAGVSIDAGILQAIFNYTKPSDSDFAGVMIWVGASVGFTANSSTLAFDGADNAVVLNRVPGVGPFVGGTTYYLRCAGYDAFGKDSLTMSGAIAFTPTASFALSNNSITAVMIQDGILDVAKFAAGVEPVKSFATTPTVKSTNTIFNTTDQRLYTWNGTAYTKSTPAADISGQIADAQIAAIGAAKMTGQLVDAQIAGLAASKMTGQLTNAQLAAIDATKVTGQLTNAQVAALDATKITGTLSDAQIAAIGAAKITGQLANAQIAAIDTSKLVGTIGAAQLAVTIGGGNLVVNSSFEAADTSSNIPNGCEVYNNAGISVTVTRSSGRLKGYAFGIRANASTASTFGVYANSTLGGGVVGGWQPNTTYVISWYARKVNGAGWSTMNNLWNATPTTVWISRPNLTTAFQRYEARITTGSTVEALGRFYISVVGNTVNLDEIHVDDVQVVVGDTNSGYAPMVGEILPGTITATEVANDAITSPKILAGAIVAGKIAANAVSANEIAAGSITTAKLTAGAVTANEISAGAITTNKLAAGAVTANEIAANAVTAGKIAAGSITAGKIAAGAIVAADIAADTITAGQIAANAITATELAAGAVTTAKLVANAVTANEIAAGAITTAKLTAGAVTANELAAGSVTAGKIAALSITAAELAAGSITAAKMSIGTGQNLLRLSTFPLSLDGWSQSGNTGLTAVFAKEPVGTYSFGETAYILFVGSPNGTYSYARPIDPVRVVAGKSYEASVYLNTHRCSAFVYVEWYNASGVFVGSSSGNAVANINGSGDTMASYVRSGVIAVAPANAATAIFYALTNYSGQTNPATYFLRGYFAEAYPNQATLSPWAPSGVTQIDGGQITASSVTASQIAAGTITATQIAADTITASQIAASAITASELAVDAVVAGKIAANAVNAREIAAGAITTTKLAVTSQGNAINDDPHLEDYANSWVIAGAGTTVGSGSTLAGTAGNFHFTNFTGATDSTVTTSRKYAIEALKTYSLTANLYAAASNSRSMYIFVNFFDAAGSFISTSWGGTMSGYVFGGLPPANVWTRSGAQFGAGTALSIPSLARTCNVGVWFQYSGSGSSSVQQAAQDIRLEPVSGSTLIQDGAITTNKILASAITADKIAANSITADKISVTSLAAVSTNFGDVHVGAGGGLHGGSFTGWAWPASGTGFYVGPNGILLGNYNTGPYLQLYNNGSIASQNFNINSSGIVSISNAVMANPTLDAFTLSGTFDDDVTGINASSGGTAQTCAFSASASGGKSPYKFVWSYTKISGPNNLTSSGSNPVDTGFGITLSAGNNSTTSFGVVCTCTDANGRSLVQTGYGSITYGSM